jgi:hypothetical protein
VSSFLLIYCFSIFIILYFKGKLKENDENFFKKEIDRREKKKEKFFPPLICFGVLYLKMMIIYLFLKRHIQAGEIKKSFFPYDLFFFVLEHKLPAASNI